VETAAISTVGLGGVEVSEISDITEILLLSELVTNISSLPDSYAMPWGCFSRVRFATTLLVLSDITETESAPWSATKISPLPESKAIP
jgi:hypothetical protein